MKVKPIKGRITLNFTHKEAKKTMDALVEAIENLGDDARDARSAKEHESAKRHERVWRQLDKLCNLLDKGCGESKERDKAA